ncbi:CPBP family intramembrane glutamic endopeptidase [Flavobacterium caeni]|uniref:CAAX prenyl protease 2/Lysostaphin resistance protein A-like domain-containing protein n=1 Tax=Flavobacterium caeni TaxID=490189 RepID=A0A1G5JP36_9FLAO|nr:CPBP family intramembrane glutamic endopeptidase [Flavobacterium caeni]SCY90155.1 hypothetical protein SAMN02927903_02811 [Flavobacterium caeni]
MFIEQARKPNMGSGDYFVRYFLGIVIIALGYVIGQIPFTVAVLAKSMADGTGINIDPAKIMSVLEPNLSLFLVLLTFVATMLAIFLVVKLVHKQSFLSLTTARPQVDWKRIFFAFGVWATFSVVSTLALYWAYPEDFVVAFKPVPFLILLVIATLMIPIQTSAEEYLFRGYLMQGIGLMAGNRWVPLLVTSVLFGGMHLMNPEVGKMGYIVMVYYIGTGFFLGILTLMDDGLELALGFHAANNLLTALLVTSDWTAFQTYSVFKSTAEPDATLDVLLPVVVVFPILLFIFSRRYGWRDWWPKLTGKLQPISTVNTADHGNPGDPDLPQRPHGL